MHPRLSRRSDQALVYPVLLGLSVLDASAYSIIAPLLPRVAATAHVGPGAIGLFAGAFPLSMLAGFLIAGRLVRRGAFRTILALGLLTQLAGASVFLVSTDFGVLVGGRLVMGVGSGGLWMGITFATLACWPDRAYRFMSRIYAAYSAGTLVGPLLGALGGTAAPFAVFMVLAAVAVVLVGRLPALPAGTFHSDYQVLRLRSFWTAAVAVFLGMMSVGLVDGVLPLHFALHFSQLQIGLAYAAMALVVTAAAALAGHRVPSSMVGLGAVAVCAGMAVAASSHVVPVWLVCLAVLGFGAGAVQTGATGMLLHAIPADRLVTAMIVWSQLGILGYLTGPVAGGALAEAVGYPALALLPLGVALLLAAIALPGRRRTAPDSPARRSRLQPDP